MVCSNRHRFSAPPRHHATTPTRQHANTPTHRTQHTRRSTVDIRQQLRLRSEGLGERDPESLGGCIMFMLFAYESIHKVKGVCVCVCVGEGH